MGLINVNVVAREQPSVSMYISLGSVRNEM